MEAVISIPATSLGWDVHSWGEGKTIVNVILTYINIRVDTNSINCTNLLITFHLEDLYRVT